jgi:hypothetical protein
VRNIMSSLSEEQKQNLKGYMETLRNRALREHRVEQQLRFLYLFFCSAFCAFFSNTCFLGFLTFFLPLVPMSIPPSLISSHGLPAHFPDIHSKSNYDVFFTDANRVSCFKIPPPSQRCDGLRTTPLRLSAPNTCISQLSKSLLNIEESLRVPSWYIACLSL